jgi:hypothetical protein
MESFAPEQAAFSLLELKSQPQRSDFDQNMETKCEGNMPVNFPYGMYGGNSSFQQESAECVSEQELLPNPTANPIPRPKSFAPVGLVPLKQKKDRKANFSDAEMQVMIEGLQDNCKLLFKLDITQSVVKKKIRVWQKIADQVNRVNGGTAVRTIRDLRTKFCTMKKNARAAERGAGPSDEFTEQMVKLMRSAGRNQDDSDDDDDDQDSDREKVSRERKINYSKEEVLALVREVLKYYNILSNDTNSRSAQMCSLKQRCWQLVAAKVNSVSPTVRTWNEVREKFKSLKKDAKPKRGKLQKNTDRHMQLVYEVVNSLPQNSDDRSSIEAAWARLSEDADDLYDRDDTDLIASISKHILETSRMERQEKSVDSQDSDVEIDESVDKDTSADNSQAGKSQSESPSHNAQTPKQAGSRRKTKTSQKAGDTPRATGDGQDHTMDKAVLKLCDIVKDYLEDLASIVST